MLALGLGALAAAINARVPSRGWWMSVLRWPAVLFTSELAALLCLLGLMGAGALVAFGALRDGSGWVGLAALVLANVISIPPLLTSRRLTVRIEGGDRPGEPVGPILRYPRRHVLLPWLMLLRRDIRRIRDVEFGRPDGTPLHLDVFMPAVASVHPCPAIVQVHGGGFVTGSRRQALPLVTHLAASGWVVFNIDYRLSPRATFPDQLVDVKRAIAWVRAHAEDYGVDPTFVAVTGGSAGATLASLAALTASDPALQPGFEEADTAVAALVSMYGVYDLLDERGENPAAAMRLLERHVFKQRRRDAPEVFRAASPMHRVRPDAPPAFIVHGDADTIISVDQGRAFAQRLRAASRYPVLYAEIRGGHHAFDVLPSWRAVAVVEAAERFLSAVWRDRERAGVSGA